MTMPSEKRVTYQVPRKCGKAPSDGRDYPRQGAICLSGPKDDNEISEVEEQASRFWTSPWAMTTEWRSQDLGQVSRVYLEHTQVVVEIELPEVSVDRVAVDVDRSQVHVAAEDGSMVPLTVPLPMPVEPASADVVRENHKLTIRVGRLGAGS